MDILLKPIVNVNMLLSYDAKYYILYNMPQGDNVTQMSVLVRPWTTNTIALKHHKRDICSKPENFQLIQSLQWSTVGRSNCLNNGYFNASDAVGNSS